MSIKITFPGNLKVDAEVGGFTIHTDQGTNAGGDGSAPSPYEVFLSSLGACAGIYVLGFCKSRGIPTDGIYLEQDLEYDQAKHKVGKIKIAIKVPADFPEKYYDALVKSASLCAVKKTMEDPPEFEVVTEMI